jgi:hypothetical protein
VIKRPTDRLPVAGKGFSAAGDRTRASGLKGRYPNRLDHSGNRFKKRPESLSSILRCRSPVPRGALGASLALRTAHTVPGQVT